MVNYQNAKIYKIVCNNTGKQYIGSTTKKYLCNRLTVHRLSSNKCTSKEIIDAGNYSIVLVELYPCNSKDELHKRERHYIDTLDCVNKYIPGRTEKERNKEYYELNKDKVKERAAKWNKDNKEKRGEKITCICGKSITKSVKARHEKSQYHLKYLDGN